jgi:hypothetical protein
MSASPLPLWTAESVFDLGERLTTLLKEGASTSISGQLDEATRERVADVTEALRARVIRRPARDVRSLFDLDERLIDLMDRAEEESTESGEIPETVAQEIMDYLEAFRSKVDRVVGYWRWQESIAGICGQECERLAARKRAAEARVTRLKGMLLYFMAARGLKRLGGERASIGMQTNGMASLHIDDPFQLEESFFERDLRINRAELQGIVSQLPEGEARRRLEAALKQDGWEVNASAVRAAIANNLPVEGARLVKGSHVRIR